MKFVTNYINENLASYRDERLKLSEDDRGRLVDLDARYDKIMETYHIEKSHFQNVTNMHALIERYEKHLRDKDDYDLTFDKIEYEHSKYEDAKWYATYHDEVEALITEFYGFRQCYLTKFYIEKLMLVKRNIEYIHRYVTGDKVLPDHFYRPTDELYNRALAYIKSNPLRDIHKDKEILEDDDYKRVVTPEQAKDEMQREIDKRGYGWRVLLDDNLVPRMSVKTYREFHINSHASFSKIDIDSLKRHEINTHVARKYNGLRTGLYLFLYGLHGAGTYDEGMAIYNSLDKSPKPKPNILFYISKKIVLLKHLFAMSTDELFKTMKRLTGATDKDIIIAIVRGMRCVFWNESFASSLDASYLTGYELVRKMDDDARGELLRYNIGPEQLFEIDDIKRFLELNEFPSLIGDDKKSKKSSK